MNLSQVQINEAAKRLKIDNQLIDKFRDVNDPVLAKERDKLIDDVASLIIITEPELARFRKIIIEALKLQ